MEILSADLMMPQVGQGAIAVECRSDERDVVGLLSAIGDHATEIAVTTERSFLASFGTGCSLPVGALATLANGHLRAQGMVASHDGTRVLRGSLQGDEPLELGRALASALMERGALELLGPDRSLR
jgi:hydroxymethylbilane synthase